MIFNFSQKYQFSTNLKVNDKSIELVKETKLLGTYLTENLKWNKNCAEIIKKANKRMQLLSTAASFTENKNDLKKIYITYIRSILEQSSVVWHSGLTKKNRRDIERVQKSAVRVIIGKKYDSYKKILKELKLENLDTRREKLCLKFAKKLSQK